MEKELLKKYEVDGYKYIIFEEDTDRIYFFKNPLRAINYLMSRGTHILFEHDLINGKRFYGENIEREHFKTPFFLDLIETGGHLNYGGNFSKFKIRFLIFKNGEWILNGKISGFLDKWRDYKIYIEEQIHFDKESILHAEQDYKIYLREQMINSILYE